MGVATYYTDVPVHSCYPLVCIRLQQLARDQLLQSKNHAVFASYANRRAAILYCLECVFNLDPPVSGLVLRVVVGLFGFLLGSFGHQVRRRSCSDRSRCLLKSIQKKASVSVC
jgi:hypothetical protein